MCGGTPSKQGTFEEIVQPARFLALSNKREAVLRLIRDIRVGITAAEICKALRLSHASVSARVHDLQRSNLIVPKETVKRGTPARWVPVDGLLADTAQLEGRAA